MPIPVHDRASVIGEIEVHTREGALYYSDEWQAYATLKLRGEHATIRKALGRPMGGTVSMASRASGAMPSIDCVRTGVYRANTAIFTRLKFASGSTIGIKTSNH